MLRGIAVSQTRTVLAACALLLVMRGTSIVAGEEGSDEPGVAPKLSAREQKLREDRLQILSKGSSQRSARQSATDRLPLDRLNAAQRKRASDVLANVSLFRELPTVAFESEPDVYKYFLDCPDMAVALWRAMGISKFSMSQRSATEYEADCGDGTSGVIEILYRSETECLLYCDGGFKTPLMTRPIRSQCLFSLDWSFGKGRDDKPVVKHRAAMFVCFPSQTVETAARVISPISNHIIDHNFREISLFVHMMSVAMQRQPGWVEQTANKMDNVLESRRQQFLKLTAQVYVRSRKREVSRSGLDEATIDEVLGPIRRAGAETAGESRLSPRGVQRMQDE